MKATTDLKTLKINEKTFALTSVPSRHGADYWTQKPAVKAFSLINGSVVWWLISLEQAYGGEANDND